MKNYKILKILDKFKKVFEKFNIDYEIMRKILQVKLTMDGRRTSTILQNNKTYNENKKESNNFIKSLWFYGLIGLFLVSFILMDNSIMFQMTIVISVVLFMVMISLISDFSSVLLDIRDKGIVLTKPINPRTLSMAKTIHICIYIFSITFALTAPSLIAGLIKYGFLFFILFFIELIFMNLFIVSLTALLYLILLKFFSGEKLKDIINYFQIVLSIVMIVGYQVIAQSFRFIDANIVFEPKWWYFLLPPVWFGAPFDMILKGNISWYNIVFTIMLIFIPILSIKLYMKYIPSFERNLQKLDQESGACKEKIGLLQKLSKYICKNKVEELFFNFAYNMMKNEREFKLKLYPSLGLAIAFPLIMIFLIFHGDKSYRSMGNKAYFSIYFCIVMIMTGIDFLKYSSNYKGASIYRYTPISKVGPIFKGTLKAFIIKFIVPIILVESIVYILIFGIRIFPDILGVFCTGIFAVILFFKITPKSLPFSKPLNNIGKDIVAETLMMMAFIGVLALIHFAFTFINYGAYIYLLIIIVLNIITWKICFNIPWKTLK